MVRHQEDRLFAKTGDGTFYGRRDMEENGKYYWLKLKRDFFKRHDIRVIESMPNGKEYVLFYLKLLVESITHNGELRFSETIPYNEEMLAAITNIDIDKVRTAMKILVELKMIEMLSDATIFMAEVQKMTGAETKWAEKKRLQRASKEGTMSLPCPSPVPSLSDKSIEYRDKSIEYRDKSKSIESTGADAPTHKPSLPKKKHGEYGRVLLDDNEYEHLKKKLGDAELRRCIAYVDESAESTGNKNKWKNWSLVLQRCSRDKWGVKQENQQERRFNVLSD